VAAQHGHQVQIYRARINLAALLMWQNGNRGVKAALSIGCRNAVITNWSPKFAKTAIQHACSPISTDNRARKPVKRQITLVFSQAKPAKD
jgi:hypothetical protein